MELLEHFEHIELNNVPF